MEIEGSFGLSMLIICAFGYVMGNGKRVATMNCDLLCSIKSWIRRIEASCRCGESANSGSSSRRMPSLIRFRHDWPLNPSNPFADQSRTLFRIAAHSKTSYSLDTDVKTFAAVTPEPLRMQKRKPTEFSWTDSGASGQKIMVPTRYTEWEEVAR